MRRISIVIVGLVLGLGLLAAPVGAQTGDDERYFVAAETGGDVLTLGEAPFHGSLADTGSEADIVDLAATTSGDGYWLTDDQGGVYAFGDAAFHGSMAGTELNRPIVAMAATPSGDGYWLAASDGGIFAFGDAGFFGSTGAITLNEPIVAMAATPSGEGYWLAARDGGVFAFGDAGFEGSMGGAALNSPMASMTPTASGDGYWMVAEDGGIFAFGDASFHGSLGADGSPAPVIDLDTALDGDGYWIVDDAGTVTAFGSAAAIDGVAAGGDEPVVGLAVRPDGESGWLATSPNADRWLGVPLPASSGDGRRIVYSNSDQRIWLVDDRNRVEDSWLVSGRRGSPSPGTYSVFSKSRHTSAGHDGITMEYMVRFAHGRRLAIGFHSIPVYSSGRPLQTEAELGQYRSAGCVRQRLPQARQLYDWADVGTTVVVLP
ncbi:MAG: L,D-transpeptidase [Actinomycetota bacterium]